MKTRPGDPGVENAVAWLLAIESGQHWDTILTELAVISPHQMPPTSPTALKLVISPPSACTQNVYVGQEILLIGCFIYSPESGMDIVLFVFN